MEIDKTTFTDLAIVNGEEFSLFNKLNLSRTVGGKDKLFDNFCSPLKTIESIEGIQQTIKIILKNITLWPLQISNGSVLMIEKFYHANIDIIPSKPTPLNAYGYKYLHRPDFSLIEYSVGHAFDFIKGIQSLIDIFLNAACPLPLQKKLSEAKQLIDKPSLDIVKQTEKAASLTIVQKLQLGRYLLYNYKHNMALLLDIYFQLDAWYGMAMAVKQYSLKFPEFLPGDKPLLKVSGLYHLLLQKPVGYDIALDPSSNFIFLTGANMAGKSTFIKAVGAAVFLAHIGMGVPASQMQLSLFNGILSNINVVDNIGKGESYFYNEVQRIKSTVSKISDGKKWLVLIDELFKGTNVDDAMKCSSAVIEGLVKIKNSLFILSTHLYEIGDGLKKYPGISFNYFETAVENDQLLFSYQLKKGISNDRLGYLILKNEGVVDMLAKL